jgi:HEAT repeat protein
MEAGAEVFQAVLPFAADEEALTRKEAIVVLGQSDDAQAVAAIRQALMDPNVTVRQAAEEVIKNNRSSVTGNRSTMTPTALQV